MTAIARTTPAIDPHRRRPRQLLPGPLMELIRAIRERQVGDVIAVYSSDNGSRTDIPKWVEKAGHGWSALRPATATTRSSSRSALGDQMNRVVILGGGVGGTLAANLLVAQARRPDRPGRGDRNRRRRDRQHVYQPGFMYIAMGGERAEQAPAPGALAARLARHLVVDESLRVDEPSGGRAGRRAPLPYDQLVLATGSRIVPEEIEHFDEEAAPLLHRGGGSELRHALDAFKGGRIVIGIAGMPYKCPPAPLEVAFLIEAELRERGIRETSEIHFCSPIGRAFTIESVSEMATPILAEKGIELHTFFNVETIDPERKVVQSLEGEELPYDLLILVPPHKGQQFLIDSGLAPAPGGWLPTDRHTLQVGGRPNVFALGDATDLPLSKAGSTAHFEAPVVAERIAAAIEGREPNGKHAALRGQRDVLLRDRRRQGHAPASTTTIRPGRRSPTACGTWARSCSTRRTGTPSRGDASERRPIPAQTAAALDPGRRRFMSRSFESANSGASARRGQARACVRS